MIWQLHTISESSCKLKIFCCGVCLNNPCPPETYNKCIRILSRIKLWKAEYRDIRVWLNFCPQFAHHFNGSWGSTWSFLAFVKFLAFKLYDEFAIILEFHSVQGEFCYWTSCGWLPVGGCVSGSTFQTTHHRLQSQRYGSISLRHPCHSVVLRVANELITVKSLI